LKHFVRVRVKQEFQMSYALRFCMPDNSQDNITSIGYNLTGYNLLNHLKVVFTSSTSQVIFGVYKVANPDVCQVTEERQQTLSKASGRFYIYYQAIWVNVTLHTYWLCFLLAKVYIGSYLAISIFVWCTNAWMIKIKHQVKVEDTKS